jgi:hypothetical protein
MPARLQFTEALQKEEPALKQASRNGAKLPQVSEELKKYWHDKTRHRVPDAMDRKNIYEMLTATNGDIDAIGMALELAPYRIFEVINKDNKKFRDKRD